MPPRPRRVTPVAQGLVHQLQVDRADRVLDEPAGLVLAVGIGLEQDHPGLLADQLHHPPGAVRVQIQPHPDDLVRIFRQGRLQARGVRGPEDLAVAALEPRRQEDGGQLLRGQADRLAHGRAELGPLRKLEQDGQGQLPAQGRGGLEPALGVKDQVVVAPAQLDGGGDILPAVDAVPGGPHDLGHVGPHGVEPGAGEGPAVARARDRDLAGGGLGVSGGDDLRGPIIVAQGRELGVEALLDQPLGTGLDAAETVLTDGVEAVLEGHRVHPALVVGLVGTGLLDALQAADAARGPVDDPGFGRGHEPGRDLTGFNMEFLEHAGVSLTFGKDV